MASQDARLSKFEADFKQQKSEMTNKIDTFLKVIKDRMTSALPSDTVKNLKLNVNSTSSVLFARSYSMEDPQSSSNPFKSVNDIKTGSEVLAHAPMYIVILDKYIENLELGKNGPAYIQNEVPKKMKDPGKLELLEDFYVIDMEKDPTCPLLVGIGFLATSNAIIDCKKFKIAVGEGITMSVFGVKEVEKGMKDVPYWTTIARRKSYGPRPNTNNVAFRKMVEFLKALPINLKGNMWESEDMIKKKIDWKSHQKKEMVRDTLG
ncbi:hypothetical protein Tco_0523479 [Tanacetum coccineum]